MLEVNGRQLPPPAELTIGRYDLVEEAGRSPETGKLFTRYIASKVRIDATWRLISDAELAAMIAIIDERKPFFTLRFFDAGGWKAIEAYRGDVKYGLKIIRNGMPYWADVAIAFIER
ncbi:MAG: hypothetical protein IMX05_01495 [Hydrogenibacillus schlegelii]|nr:hypothetical protein [Hydrogenibacillus schlegelii]